MQGNYEQLKAAIAAVIKTNGNNEITGALMQQVLQSIVSQIGQNGTFAGIATPATNPGTPDQNVFYLASESGVYPNFAGYTLEAGHIAVFANASGAWTASSIEVGSSVIGGFVALDSIADLPESPSDPHIGYIVGTHLYVYVGTGGDTLDGKYKDCGVFKGPQGEDGVGFASASSPTTADGTWKITLTNGDTITINLNHTHENMAKLVVCEESDLPSTLAKDTIYAQVDDAANPTEIQSLWIAGLEFVGGGEPDYTPKLTSPRNGTTIDFDGQSTATIVVKGRNLTSNLSVVVTGDFTVTANGQSVSIIDASNVTDGASVSLLLTKGNDFLGGTIVIRSAELDEDVTLSITDSSEIVALTGVKFTGTQWLETDYKANPKTEFILKCRLETTSITNVIDGVNRKNWILGGNDANGCYELYHLSKKQSGGSNAPYNLNISLNSLSESRILLSDASNMLTDPLIIQYSKTNGTLTAGNASTSGVTAKTGSNTGNLRICCRLTNGEDICYSRFYMTIYEFSIIEDGENVRHYIPKRRFGSPGLYDTVTGSFLTSKTNDPLVEVN